MFGAEQFASVRRLCFDDPTGNEVEALETPIIDLAFNERNHCDTQTTLKGNDLLTSFHKWVLRTM